VRFSCHFNQCRNLGKSWLGGGNTGREHRLSVNYLQDPSAAITKIRSLYTKNDEPRPQLQRHVQPRIMLAQTQRCAGINAQPR
jgi:hypothetical protein